MKKVSQQLILLPFWHGLSNSRVCSAVPYSCLLFSMCRAYAEIGLLVLMYLVCSLYLMVINLPDCPTYTLLQVLHFSLYIPLGLFVFCFLTSC
jgi:hypothetical protein